MNEHQSLLVYLASIGAALGLGKFLVSNEPLVWRLILGRIILGSGASVAAGCVYFIAPNLHPLALIGIASLAGLAGAAWLEIKFKQKIDSMVATKEASKNA